MALLLNYTVHVLFRHIGFSVYNVFVLCVVGAPMSLALKHQPDASFAIVSTIIIFATSLTIGFVFIPKVSGFVEKYDKMYTLSRPNQAYHSTASLTSRKFVVESPLLLHS